MPFIPSVRRTALASLTACAGSGATAVGEYCKELGSILPVDAATPRILFQLNLPVDWNRRP